MNQAKILTVLVISLYFCSPFFLHGMEEGASSSQETWKTPTFDYQPETKIHRGLRLTGGLLLIGVSAYHLKKAMHEPSNIRPIFIWSTGILAGLSFFHKETIKRFPFLHKKYHQDVNNNREAESYIQRVRALHPDFINGLSDSYDLEQNHYFDCFRLTPHVTKPFTSPSVTLDKKAHEYISNKITNTKHGFSTLKSDRASLAWNLIVWMGKRNTKMDPPEFSLYKNKTFSLKQFTIQIVPYMGEHIEEKKFFISSNEYFSNRVDTFVEDITNLMWHINTSFNLGKAHFTPNGLCFKIPTIDLLLKTKKRFKTLSQRGLFYSACQNILHIPVKIEAENKSAGNSSDLLTFLHFTQDEKEKNNLYYCNIDPSTKKNVLLTLMNP